MTELFQKFLLLSLFCAGAGAAALLLLCFLRGISERTKSDFLFAAILLPFGGALLSPLAKLFPKPPSLPREAALPPTVREIAATSAANPIAAIPTAPTANPAPLISPAANPLAAVDWWEAASVLWAAVAVFLLLQAICSHIRLMRSLGQCRRRLRSENRLAVYEVSADISPFLTGIFRGSVYLPENRYSEEERAMALAHEQFHFARGDALKRIVISVLRCINWLNPPLRIILNRLSDQLEYACDEAVTKTMDHEQKRRYGFMLLKTAGFSADRAGFSVGLSRPSKALKRRIGIFMQEKKKFGTAAKALAAAVLSAAAVSVVGISAAAFLPETENTPAAADVPATAGERNETDKESAAFAPEAENTPAEEENDPAVTGEQSKTDEESAAALAPETENTSAAADIPAETEEQSKANEESTLLLDDGKVRIYSGAIPEGETPPLYAGAALNETAEPDEWLPNAADTDEFLGYEEMKKLSPSEREAYYNAVTAEKWDFRLYIYPDELGLDMTLPLDGKYFPNGWEFNAKQLYGEYGCNVYSAAEGTVVYANEYGPYLAEKTVLIEHENGYATKYRCLKDVYVETGDKVEKGQLIGTLADHFMTSPFVPNFSFDIYRDQQSLTMPDNAVYGIKPIYEYITLVNEGKNIYENLDDYIYSDLE